MQLLQENTHSDLTMSSREIAALIGKRHDHVLRDIRKLEDTYEEEGLPKVGGTYYTLPSTGNKQYPERHLTKIQVLDLITGYSHSLRIKVNRRWAELEAQAQKPVSRLEMAKRLYEAELELVQAQPKVEFYDTMADASGTFSISSVAKLIRIPGMGRNKLFSWMRENNLLMTNNEPYQRYINSNWFEVKVEVINGKSVSITRATNKGVQKMFEMLRDQGLTPTLESRTS